MGFLGAVIGGICGAVSSCIGGICSAIGGALGTACSAISSFANTIVARIPDMLEISLDKTFELIGNIISSIAEFLGLKEPEKDSPEELAAKAEISEKKLEDFDSYEEYINYLHDDVELDDDKLEELKEGKENGTSEYYALASTGNYLYMKGTNEKLGIGNDIDPLLYAKMIQAGGLNIPADEQINMLKNLIDE